MSLLTNLLQKKEDKKYFLILGVEEHRISAAVAEITGETIKLIGSGESEFGENTQEVDAADIAISTAEKNLPENVLIEKVIFGLPIIYIEDGKIKSEPIKRLKKITQDLSLTPYGFIEYPQALSFYLEKKEESPPTLLLVSIGKKNLTFSLIRIGKIEQNVVIPKTEELTKDFENALKHLKSEIFPSRIVLYDEGRQNEHMEVLREELLTYPWHKHSSFLHTPKIEILESSTLLTALVDTVGGSLLKKLYFDEEQTSKEPTSKQTIEKTQEFLDENDFGFIQNKDIIEEKTDTAQKIQPNREVVDFEMTNKKEVVEEKEINATEGDKKTSIFNKFRLPNFFSFSFLTNKSTPILIFLGAIGFFALVMAIFFWFYPSATVNLIVYPNVTSKKVDVIFTTDKGKTDGGKNIILTKTITEEITGEKIASTSGKKKVGEPARGEITIYNKTLSAKTFPKQTVLIGDNFKFTLDEEINIASASDTGEGLAFGKTTAKVTAVEVGPEANIAAGTTFIFKDFPQTSYYAKNSQNFSGGTSREVNSVSKEDQDKLLSELSDELTSKAKQKLFQKLTTGEKLLDNSIKKEIVSKKFSKDIDSEAKEIKLTLVVRVNALVFKEEDLTNLAKEENVSTLSGYTLDLNRTQIKIEDINFDKKENMQAKAVINSYYLPEINLEKIKKEISGKSYNQAKNIISSIPTIGGFNIIRENYLPFFTDLLPLNQKNIQMHLVIR